MIKMIKVLLNFLVLFCVTMSFPILNDDIKIREVLLMWIWPAIHSHLLGKTMQNTKWGILFIICVIPVGLFFKYLLYSSVNFKSLIWTYVILVIVYLIAYFLTLHTKKEDR